MCRLIVLEEAKMKKSQIVVEKTTSKHVSFMGTGSSHSAAKGSSSDNRLPKR